MEGKAVLYDCFAHVGATPVLIDTLDPEHFVEIVLRVAPGFGAIHLEDIRTPDCFLIEDKLRAALDKPVFHDDQHGAGAAFAGDGRSINNALAFPDLLKGALEARSRAITDEMLVAAADTTPLARTSGRTDTSAMTWS